MNKKEFKTIIGGKELTAVFSDLAGNAHGSVMVKYGESVILATAVMSQSAKEGTDFLPLTVEFEEKFYASGQILGNRYTRREGKPSEEAVLSGRIIDRTIRPLFDNWIRNEIQVIVSTVAVNSEAPDIMGVLGASLAIGTSHIPWNGPVTAVRILKKKGSNELIVNPLKEIRESADIDFELVACGKDGKINMIELGGNEAKESDIISAMEFASSEIEKIQAFQKQVIKEIGKAKISIPQPIISDALKNLFTSEIKNQFEKYILSNIPGGDSIEELRRIWSNLVTEKLPEESEIRADELFEEEVNQFIHDQAIDNGKRADGRRLDEIRPLYAQAGGISSLLHGSGIFYRGQTHIMSILTLGAPGDAQVTEGTENGDGKRYIHQYNFPPFSTGETGKTGNPSRRSIGHGALAEKALTPMIPAKEIFPYTIRVVSEAVSSNGSTSMGSVCGSTLALLDAGVPIKRPVAGISSGVMIRNDKEYKVLTDIQGPEDHYGDMDFKVAGTREGVTAIQMDVKVDGIPVSILGEAFEKAKSARFQILDVIEKAIPEARKDISVFAPKILTLKIKQDMIGLVIGPGGKMIKGIKEETGVEAIDINDDGTVFITGKNGTAEKAYTIINGMTREYKAGERFEGVVTKIMEFGAFVKIGYDTEGLVHISEIAPFRVDVVSKYLQVGQKIPVIIKEKDERGRYSLSIKQADKDFIKPIISKTVATVTGPTQSTPTPTQPAVSENNLQNTPKL